MDTLSLLQQFIKQKKPVFQDTEDSDTICFGNEMKYKKNTEVDFFSSKDNKNLTLGQIWFYLKNCKAVVSKYRTLCTQNNVTAVAPQDQKPLLAKLDFNPDDYKPQEIDDLFSKSGTITTASAVDDSERKTKEDKSRKIEQITNSKELSEETEKKRQKISTEQDDDTIMFDESVKDAQYKFREYIDQIINHKLDTVESVKFDHEAFDKFIKFDQSNIKKLNNKEIPMSTIASIVKTPKPNSNFKEVLDIAKIVKEDEAIRKKVSEKEKEKTKTKEKEAAQIAVLHPPREKPDPSAAWKEVGNLDEDELQGINPVGTNINMSSTLKSAITENATASNISTTASSKATNSSSSSQSTPSKSSSSHSHSHHKLPIIILPPDTSSLLSLYNVKQFLEGCQYVPTEELKSKTQDKPRKLVVHNPLHKSEHYLVTDNPERDLSKDDWNRVVAVFTTGKTWQFKNWKGFSQKSTSQDSKNATQDPTPAEIFSKAKGFHLTFDNLEVSPVIKSWNVVILKISSNNTKRYTDQAVVHSFWKAVSAKK